MKVTPMLFVLVMLGAGAARAEMKIGVVDMQKCLTTVEAGKKAKSSLETEFNKKKKEIQGEEQAIQKLHEELSKQASVLSEAARNKKQAEINDRLMKLQQSTQKSQLEIQKKEQELTEPIIVKIRKLIREMAEKKGFNLILEKNENTVLYSQEKDDLTTEVITQFNGANKG